MCPKKSNNIYIYIYIFFDGSNNKLIIHANKHNITVPKTVEILGIVFFFFHKNVVIIKGAPSLGPCDPSN